MKEKAAALCAPFTPRASSLSRVNSPHRPVSSGADGPQRRVPLRDVPRGFLDLQPVKPRSDGGLHGAALW